ncbi:2-amino-4-hydroxy-6-hydroxymethyldihydropteridine diphosphokinase [Sphingomicrobium flavum]|uniref:2-amino-4-hydroxy-6- hydroxymethyldihydropteridine diphosphokinase n=1 Tax=Sphingomicrobium flavum TaxID=1229164 RepID=UPI0021ADE559|nr:2-amino-4-hydroxy-6-hydroxymethyldihydropteridine diphosphokinase [Sphingomicrobium flavum]
MADATSHLYAIGIGSNRRHIRHGRPTGVVSEAIARLDGDYGLFEASPILINPAMGGAGRDFANAVAIVESPLAPEEMLAALKAMEVEFGRRPGKRWGERVLDLDILAWDGGKYRSPSLTIPHPALRERRFALIPLANIAPNWRPAGGPSFRQLAAHLTRARPTKIEIGG